MSNESSEKDFLVYREDKPGIPLALKVAWTALILFGVVYLFQYALPDLKIWLGK